jgi:L-2-hydroxyglutarate oxidase LhgO
MAQADIAIIGSGIVGIAIARGLKEIDGSLQITIFERESSFGTHASARNSGVMHAGFYYSPESMKARFCREGRDELEQIAIKNSIPVQKVGKVVVAQNDDEEIRLKTLLERGKANGVTLEILEARDLKKIEPLAQTSGSFLWSPNTSISDPTLINSAIREDLISRGVVFISNASVSAKEDKWFCNDDAIDARYFINAAGAWSLDLAQPLGIGSEFRTMPFLGLYKQTNVQELPIRTLVYPVPHPINPFLGVHFTLTIDGSVKIGPSALPIIGRDQYSFNSMPTISELNNFGKNLVSLAKGSKHDLNAMMRYEVPKLATRNLVNASANLVPDAKNVKQWKKKAPGIRGQLINKATGELLQDFLVDHVRNSTHILNAVSPGWTASIPFGRYIAQTVVERLSSS